MDALAAGDLRHLGDEIVAATVAGGEVDCLHRAAAVAAIPSGDRVWALGDPQRLVFERSIAKPMRALACMRTGATKAFAFDDADVALVAGSHSGTAAHASRALRMLDRLRLSEDAICTPPRLPLGTDAMWELAGAGGGPRVAHGECSGEHIGALAACLQLGYPIDGYWRLEHPLQSLYRSTFDELVPGQSNARAIYDRCGMPTFMRPLAALATMFARLIALRRHDSHADRLWRAIIAHPRVYTGRDRFVGLLMETSQGKLVGKCGAEGLYVVGWLDSGVALAVKVADGNHRAAPPVVERAALELGLPWPASVESQLAADDDFGTVIALRDG